MATTAVAATSAGTNATSSATKGSVRLAETFDNFLTLLTKQLQNQDPLSPMDTNQFTQQLVQFTGVEQSVATNKNLETIISLFQGNQFSDMVAFIGKTVEAKGSSVNYAGSGNASWSYTLDAQAFDTKINVFDEAGDIVYSGVGETGVGRHDFVWDGRNNAGNLMPAGAYKIVVNAKEPGGKAIGSSVTATGRITGVEVKDGTQTLMMGNVPVSFGDVLKIRETAS